MADRISVTLLPKGRDDLAVLTAATGMSSTDLVNRALGMLRLVHDATAAGDQVAILRTATGATETVHLL